MADTIVDAEEARRRARSPILHEPGERGDAVRTLAAALDEAAAAQFRMRHEMRPIGLDGKGFDERWNRVETLVTSRNIGAVEAAWQDAIRLGWTEQELREAGLRSHP
jgi:hypothetical protein